MDVPKGIKVEAVVGQDLHQVRLPPYACIHTTHTPTNVLTKHTPHALTKGLRYTSIKLHYYHTAIHCCCLLQVLFMGAWMGIEGKTSLLLSTMMSREE